MKLNLDNLEQMLSLILEKYREVNGNDIVIENDYYWDLDENEVYNVSNEPSSFLIGQITDDWETLKSSFSSDDLLPYDLQRIANILKALSIEKPIYI